MWIEEDHRPERRPLSYGDVHRRFADRDAYTAALVRSQEIFHIARQSGSPTFLNAATRRLYYCLDQAWYSQRACSVTRLSHASYRT